MRSGTGDSAGTTAVRVASEEGWCAAHGRKSAAVFSRARWPTRARCSPGFTSLFASVLPPPSSRRSSPLRPAPPTPGSQPSVLLYVHKALKSRCVPRPSYGGRFSVVRKQKKSHAHQVCVCPLPPGPGAARGPGARHPGAVPTKPVRGGAC